MAFDRFDEFATPEQLLEFYRKNHWRYELLARTVANFLKSYVLTDAIERIVPLLHKVESRAKDVASLYRNLESSNVYKSFTPEEIKDLAAVRLIFYFSQDLITFAKRGRWLEQGFGQYARTSFVHKTRPARPDDTRSSKSAELITGYDTYHFHIEVKRGSEFWHSLKNGDQEILEGLRCEVQMRTILRHGWAEVEHDVRYKVDRVYAMPIDKRQHRRLTSLALHLQRGDQLLDDIFLGIISDPLRSKPSGKQIVKSSPATPPADAYSIGGLTFDFQALDLNIAQPPKICRIDQIFDVDKAMKDLLQVENYKQKMWDELKLTNPQFIHAISHDSTVVRVCDWDAGNARLTVQPARYTDQVVTNHKQAMSVTIPDTKTKVSHLAYGTDGKLRPFSESPFANNLGVGCVARTMEGLWLISQRSDRVAYEPGKWGCSASGALEWTELGFWNAFDFDSWICGGMRREIEEELGLEVEARQLKYLGLFRELGRGGKPQIYFLLDLASYNKLAVENRIHTYIGPNSEHQRSHFVNDRDARILIGNNRDEVLKITGSGDISEELRMNLALALQYTQSTGGTA